MNSRIYIVDRVDQVRWYVEPDCQTFCLQLDKNHHQIRQWLEENTSDVVVISGQGVMPRMGVNEHPNNVFSSMSREQFKLYFASDNDALLFKLTWGGQ